MPKELVKHEEAEIVPTESDLKEENAIIEKEIKHIQNFHYAELKISEADKKKLFAPINEEDIEIRPEGLIYAPWMEYMTRLRDIFGLEWALIPIDKPVSKGNTVIWGFQLVIKGNIMGVAYGEQIYYPGGIMNWTDALEGAKSNALMRCCKGMGISLELWKPSFIRKWKAKYAESYEYFNKKKNKKEIRWKRKGSKPVEDNTPEPIEELAKNSKDNVNKVKEVFKNSQEATESIPEDVKTNKEGKTIPKSSNSVKQQLESVKFEANSKTKGGLTKGQVKWLLDLTNKINIQPNIYFQKDIEDVTWQEFPEYLEELKSQVAQIK